jgi:hypothetical protein
VSRGPGRWEREILAALDHVAAFYLTDLLPNPHTRSDVVALNRAANNLYAKNKVEMVRWLACFTGKEERPLGFLTIYQLGYPEPTRAQITRL